MRRSREVSITLLIAAALTSLGCQDDPEPPRHCVDAQNHLLPDSSCQTGSSSGVFLGAHYVYGGSSGGNVGDTVEGSSVSRGGFGHGGGESGDAAGE